VPEPDGRTHWEGCEREHLDCALARLAERTRERDEARHHLREIARVADTLSPQEFINHTAAGLGIDRHEYSGTADPNRSIIELMQERDALRREVAMLREALERVWAAIGDALCSGSGIALPYGQSVSGQVQAALAASSGDWLERHDEQTRADAREACAKVAEDFDASGAEGYDISTWGEGVGEGAGYAKRGIAAAIRAREVKP